MKDKSFYDNYQRGTDLTAQYPEAGEGTGVALAYISLGLISEIVELFEITEEEDLCKEFGDICWYTARFFQEVDFTSKINPNPSEVLDFQSCVISGLKITEDDITNRFMSQHFCGVLSDKVKKLLRDGESMSPEKRKDSYLEILSSLVAIFNASVSFCRNWSDVNGYPFSTQEFIDKALQANYDKLTSRKERGVIAGSGDNR